MKRDELRVYIENALKKCLVGHPDISGYTTFHTKKDLSIGPSTLAPYASVTLQLWIPHVSSKHGERPVSNSGTQSRIHKFRISEINEMGVLAGEFMDEIPKATSGNEAVVDFINDGVVFYRFPLRNEVCEE